MEAIQTRGLRRTYTTTDGLVRRSKRTREAVVGIDLDIPRGELYGLLGPNGAGKTTTIKILSTLLLPTGGTAHVLGHDVSGDVRELRRRIGYVFGGDRGLYDRISARDNLRLFSELYSIDPKRQRRRIAEVVDLVGLTGRESDRVESYSRGMRQRLHLARGLLHEPDVLFLDEPSIGVDAVAARDLRRLVRAVADSGTTVILTTHYMQEADELCDRIGIIASGRIVAEGTPADLKRLVATGSVLDVEVYGIGERELAAIRQVRGVRRVHVSEGDLAQTVTVEADADVDLAPAVLPLLAPLRVGRVWSREPTLEDAYVALVEPP